MPKYLIERTIPGAGILSSEELRAASANSLAVLKRLGPDIQWVHSYVTDDKITCVYIAPDEATIRVHASEAGLPVDAVLPIRTRIDPTTADDPTARSRAKTTIRSLVGVALGVAMASGLAACSEPTVGMAALETAQAEAPVGAVAGVGDELGALRRATAPFHRFERAQQAGWTLLVPGCRDNPPEGGMGWHYANPAYLDAELDVRTPEALIYEPQENGRLTLVGVEYVVPFSILPPDAEPPTLFGQTFKQNPGDQLWMLHVWAWRHNPDGIFATWNPNVSCRFAS